MFTFLATIAATTAAEYFIAGGAAAITLYCGAKLPKDKRK